MTKTKKHPAGYHKDADAEQACWACNESGLLDVSEDDKKKAAQYMRDGYKQVSSKYRLLARVQAPSFEEAVTFAPNVPEFMRKEVKRAYEYMRNWGHQDSDDKVELTPSEFRAFKMLERQPPTVTNATLKIFDENAVDDDHR